ncbi:AraC family transcriptional regulator [Bythopirellula polymerisocia]|uniref:Xylose operon regulatory protein n=1 Tax=Bythopirellula polymerisocia TaxID=2528003 RepID=A0A5C6CT38_9BACT|nr:xylose operon transcription regulator XylR [Bythopirellula polymerisocia]TWU27750.1 Xylose operon regulatory protein [Bythopirellula polymerisocia]
MTQPQDIALAFPRGGHLELLIEGVLSYVSEKQLSWCYITALESHGMSILDLVNWPGDGILAAINTEEEAACAKASKVPVVNISSALPHLPVTSCIIDNHAMGVLAADHLISKGFRSFAYCGLKDVEYSRQRQAGFEEKLNSVDFHSQEFLSHPTYFHQTGDWITQNHELAKWLDELPKPLGLFAVSDYRARQVLDACLNSGLRVPEEVAILGTGNEDLVCGHVRPTLTSVARNNFLQGYRSAEILDHLMQGLEVQGELLPIPPLEIVERDSTRTFAVSDSRLRDALEYMHEHLHQPLFSIDDITRQASVSRRWLEYAFRDALGETPYQYLRRQRLARAKRLLVEEPKTKIYKIAQSSGFSSAKQLAMTFQQDFGMSPREYRRVSKSS